MLSTIFLPFINAASCDYNTMYTARKTSVDNVKKELSIRTCILKFDQILYMKARDINFCLFISSNIGCCEVGLFSFWIYRLCYGWKWNKISSFYHICLKYYKSHNIRTAVCQSSTCSYFIYTL